MTMYLPNPDLHPTGYEPGEFIEVPATAHDVPSETRTTRETSESTPRRLAGNAGIPRDRRDREPPAD